MNPKTQFVLLSLNALEAVLQYLINDIQKVAPKDIVKEMGLLIKESQNKDVK